MGEIETLAVGEQFGFVDESTGDQMPGKRIRFTFRTAFTAPRQTLVHHPPIQQPPHLLARHYGVHQESWLIQAHAMDKPVTKRYVRSLFRAICNSLALSYGQMNLSTNVDSTGCSIIVILGTGLTMYATMMYISHRCSNNVRVIRYHKILDEMKEYMRYKQIPEAMQMRMLRYFDYYFHHNYYVDKFYMNLLPPHLKQEIHHIATVNLVRNTQMFKDVPKDVLERLVDALVLEVFATGENILKAGSASECMYFIASGTAVETLHTGQEICHLEDGDTIGELELILVENRRVVNVIAIEMCQLYRLDTKYYKEIVVQCTLSFKVVYMSALKRREQYSKMEKEANKARMKNVQLM
uniref:Cyclic nucleotide-binding domain-containing protein n=1 Tax=Timema cristinae TaxID=61476 RepID=A0A7R9H3I6_TIMCR|nr:unnamed protein product [Timema cristinae]